MAPRGKPVNLKREPEEVFWDEKDSEIILEKKETGDIPVEGGSSQADVHHNFHILHPEARAPESLFCFLHPTTGVIPKIWSTSPPLIPFLIQQNQKEQRKTISRDWTH